jgi:capsular exopolysaccharide synthesis family protein
VEAIRKLLFTVVDALPGTSARVVMVSSAVPNEGKTVVCLSLARLAAASGAKVIMLDADWRRPQLHSVVRRPNKVGLAELLDGSARPADAVYRDASGAHLVFGGRAGRKYARSLDSAPIGELLESLGHHYDYVFVDTPPVLAGADAVRLAQYVDMTLFMVRWGTTAREIAQRAIQELMARSNNVAGVVLTQVHAKRYRQYGHGALDYDYSPAMGSRAS